MPQQQHSRPIHWNFRQSLPMLEQRSKKPIASSFSRYCVKEGLLDAEVDSRIFSPDGCQSMRTSLSNDPVHAIHFNSLYFYGNQKREFMAPIQVLPRSLERMPSDIVSAGSGIRSLDGASSPFDDGPQETGSAAEESCNDCTSTTPHRPCDPVAKFLDSLCWEIWNVCFVEVSLTFRERFCTRQLFLYFSYFFISFVLLSLAKF